MYWLIIRRLTSPHSTLMQGSEASTLFERFLQANIRPVMDIDVGSTIIGQMESTIDQVSVAIEFVLFIVIVAGVLVLVAQVQASMEERQQEIVILRTLGR